MSRYYIARDRCGLVNLFDEKPTKGEVRWEGNGEILTESLFPEVKWEDEEPKVLTIQ